MPGFVRASVGFLLMVCGSQVALANNYGESEAWQFQTTADKVNQAIIQDLIQRKKNGMFAAPTYVTNIDRQYNCNVSASSVGNSGVNSQVANSPSASGHSSDALGNSSDTAINGGNPSTVSGSQDNSGAVSSSASGDTDVDVEGHAWQTLNNTQTNSGDQTATVSGSTACTFGVLN